MTKYMGLKVAKNIDTLFVGSSIPDWSLNPEYYYKLTNKKAYNMGIVHADFNEFREIIYKSILIHPEIKTILLSLELEILIPIPKIKNYDLEKYNTNLTFREVSSVFLSVDTFVSSISTVARNMSKKEKMRYHNNGMKLPFKNKGIENTYKNVIKKYRVIGDNIKKTDFVFSELKKLINDLNEKGIEVILYVPPMHVSYLEIFDFYNAWDEYDTFKVELSKIQPFYDFMFAHPICIEEISPTMKNFFDPLHSSFYTGDKILETIFKDNDDFGFLVTPENVKEQNKKNKKQFKNWQKENPNAKNWVDEILLESSGE